MATQGTHMATDDCPETASAISPSEMPRWITEELITETIRVWQPRYGKPISTDEALQIILSVGRLREVLKS
jgi:hypothetical protein